MQKIFILRQLVRGPLSSGELSFSSGERGLLPQVGRAALPHAAGDEAGCQPDDEDADVAA